MKTFNDFQKAENKENFIKSAIDDFVLSERYKNSLMARIYARQENEAIFNREFKFMSEREIEEDDGTATMIPILQKAMMRANNQIANGMFGKIIEQKIQYTIGNGIAVDENIKKLLPKHTDRSVQKIGLNSSYFGVAWAYVFVNDAGQLDFLPLKGEEFIPLKDEFTNGLMAGIRFWQAANNGTTYIELYEIDGLTTYKQKGSKIEIYLSKRNYVRNQMRYITETIISDETNPFKRIPIIPFFNNEEQISDFKKGTKRQLDLYDIIMSDFGNNLEDNLDVYWVLENYNGQSIDDFKRELEYYKTIKVGTQGKATPHTTEVPYQAREKALEILRKQIFSDAMALDMESIKGGGLTNVAIKAAHSDLDLKASKFEWGALDFVEQLIEFWKIIAHHSGDVEVKDFVRRTLVNDTEIISNLAMTTDLSEETRTEMHPYAAKNEMERKRKEAEAAYKNQGIIDDEEDDEGEEIDNNKNKDK